MATESAEEYWNHNTAYHPWLVAIAARRNGHVLDVGCGDGLLLQRLAPVSRSVMGIEPDPSAMDRARRRLDDQPKIALVDTSFERFDPGQQRFDLITFVATLHHMDLRSSLTRARGMLAPAGEIVVIGLAANSTVRDWLWSGLCLPAVRIGSRLHHETADIGVVVAEPREGLDDIRSVAAQVLPGVRIRRKLFYRYALRWSS